MYSFLEDHDEGITHEFVHYFLSVYSDPAIHDVIERISGAIVFSVQFEKFELKLFLEYRATEKGHSSQRVYCHRGLYLSSNKKMRPRCHSYYAFACSEGLREKRSILSTLGIFMGPSPRGGFFLIGWISYRARENQIVESIRI